MSDDEVKPWDREVVATISLPDAEWREFVDAMDRVYPGKCADAFQFHCGEKQAVRVTRKR